MAIAPHIEVETKRIVESKIETRRPYMSANQPHRNEPTVVPIKATKGNRAAVDQVMPYSAAIPGRTNPSVAGFITSITSPSVSTRRTPACQRLSGVESGASN